MAAQHTEKTLDYIINEMIDVVGNSRDEIFNISEEARRSYDGLQEELLKTKEKVVIYIDKNDTLEKEVRASRNRLSDVNKHFDYYSEEHIKKVYEKTHDLQTRLTILRQEEKELRDRRDRIERRLVDLEKTIERGERLASKVSIVLNYLNDDFKHINKLIEEANEKQTFGLKIIEAQEEERRKLSREIHDGPAQMLANILLRSELVNRAFRTGEASDALQEMKSVRKMVRSSLYEVRRIIYDLRPMVLDDLGLIPALKKYLMTTEEYHKINITFKAIGQDKRLNTKYEVAFFRLVQEAVQNAIKHAEASTIKVKLEINDDNLLVLIHDDGKGFDPEEKKDDSFGLIGMRERVHTLDGTLTIQSELKKGTKVFISVPYQNKEKMSK